MGIVTKPNTFTAGTTIVSTQVNSDFDTLYSLVNGLLDDANINAAAAINWSKLATVANRNIAFGAGYGISTDYTTSNNYIHQTNLALPAPMSGTGRMIQAYNTSLVAGVWAGRTVTDACTAIIETTTNTLEYWYAPSAATPAVPVWTKVFAIDLTTAGTLAVPLVAASLANGSILDRHTYRNRTLHSSFERYTGLGTTLPPDWYLAGGTNATLSVTTSVSGYSLMAITANGANTPVLATDLGYNPASGRTVRIRGEIAYLIAGTGYLMGFGLLSSSAITSGVAITFDSSNNLVVYVGGTPTTLVAAATINTLYTVMIELIGTSTLNIYLNDSTTAAFTTSSGLPAAGTIFRPGFGYNNGTAGAIAVKDITTSLNG